MKRVTIKEILRNMSGAIDKHTIVKYENLLSYKFGMPVLLIGGVANMLMYYTFNAEFLSTALNSLFIFMIALFFSLGLRLIKNESIKSAFFTGLFVAVFVFVALRFYNIIGPAVWSISLILVTLGMLHIKRTLLIVMNITILVTGFYVSLKAVPYELNVFYYISQMVALITIFFIGSSVHEIIRNRFEVIRKQMNQIFDSEEKLNLTLRSVGDGVITVDDKGIIEFMNCVAEDLTGWTKEEAKDQAFDDVFIRINEKTRKQLDSPLEPVYKNNFKVSDNILLISKSGHEIPIDDTVSPIINHEGKSIGSVIVFRDFTKKSLERKEIVYLSYHDQMTGLYNRRFFEEELKRLDTSRNYPLSIIFGDVNGLKTINDAFGHSEGDTLIKTVADILKSECRCDDIVSRTGGDEFVLLLPKTESIFAHQLVERFKEKIESKKIMNINLSVSFGHDTKTDDSQSIYNVLKDAEIKMYQKKILDSSSKRNSVIKSIINTLHIKSLRENAHSNRVSILCESLARACNLTEDDILELKISGTLHDIGKIAVDEVILNKPGPLTTEEFNQIQHHPETGFRLLGTSAEYFKIAEYVLSHHERWDGKGYPNGLKSDAIPFKSRVIAIADSYDAMTCVRPYSKIMSSRQAAEEIKKHAGSQFDPTIAKIFVEEVLGFKWGQATKIYINEENQPRPHA